MKNKIIDIIITVVISIILSFGINYLINLSNRPNGVYKFFSFTNKNTTYETIELENKSKKTQKELKFFINGIDKLKIKTSSFINYTVLYLNNDSSKCWLTVNEIPPQTWCGIVISGLKFKSEISFQNKADLNFVSVYSLADKQYNIIQESMITALIYGILLAIFYMILYSINDKRLKKIIIENNKTISDLNEIKEELKRLRKYKLLLIARNRDFERELNFWKTIISKLLMKSNEIKANELFESVTKNLQTYGTKSSFGNELSMAEYIAKIIEKEN